MRELSIKKQLLFLAIIFLLLFHLLELGYRLYQYSRYSRPLFNVLSNASTNEQATPVVISSPLMHYILNPKRPFHTADFLRVTGDVPSAKRYIVCMGGSSTYSTPVSAHDAYPAQLQRFLNREGKYTKVLNAGVPGWSLPHHLSRYIFDIRNRQKVDMVILYFGINDMWNTITKEQSLPGHSEGFKTFSNMTPFWMSYRLLVMLVWRIEKITGKNIANNNLGDFAFKKTKTTERPLKVNKENLIRFQKEFDLFLKILQEDGIHVLVVLQDTNGNFGSPEVENTFFLAQNTIQNIALDNSVTVVDMHDATKSRKEYFTDLIHMTKQGNEVRAKYLYPIVQEIFKRH